jgi:nucleoside-diphosphate-sugar epimerase
MNKILVTGANGFVGAALCSVLSTRNIPFIGAVREKKSYLDFEVGNLTGTTKWMDALAGCDVVIHLAARVHIMKDDSVDPLAAYREVNVDATLNLARQAVKNGVKRFIFVSSVKVNGEATKERPFTSHDLPAPVDPYGLSKYEAEQGLQKISRETGLEVVIVRPPLIYGPGVGANFLKLMQLIKLGIPLPFRNIRNSRSMIALDNLIDLLVLCGHHPNAANQIFMATDGDDLSISQLTLLIAHSMDKRLLLLPVSPRLVEICGRILGKSAIVDRLYGSLQIDIYHTQKLLDWHPIINTNTAIQKTVSHFLRKNN